MTIPQPVVETVGLSKRYRNCQAVLDLDLQIDKGSVYGFVGPNGAGKTTTIRMLMGLLRKSAGQAHILGFNVDDRATEMRHRVGYVPERPTFYRWMRVHQAIRFCRSLHKTWNDQLAAELLKQLELDPNKKVSQMSKGMLAKLSLVLAIAHEPDLLILDEPTSGLDPIVREEFLDGVLHNICRDSSTVLFSSHVLSDVQRLADSVGIIYEGRLLISCATDELMKATKRVRTVLADGCVPNEPAPGTIWQQVNGREWQLTVRGFSQETVDYLQQQYQVESVEVTDLALEDIFKDLVKGRRMAA
jgi:ABC-2 type transport system ATP-binding protein